MADPSYRRGLWVLVALGLALWCALGLWARSSWHGAVASAQADLQRLAAINAAPLALAVRDARRAAESVERNVVGVSALLAVGAPGWGNAISELMATELAVRFHGNETADLFQPGSVEMLASTARDGFNPSLLAAQLKRVARTRTATLGWAYQRGDSWWLPLFFVRDNGQVLLINLPVAPLLAQWQAPALPGENPVGIRSADDRVLLRRPFTPVMMGADARGTASSRLMDQARDEGATSGAVRAVANETDSVERLIGWAVVPGTDLRTLAAASTQNTLTLWRSEVAPQFASMALFIVVGLGGAALSMRRMHSLGRRERRALAEADHAQALTQAALWGSRDITWQMAASGGELHFAGDLGQLLGAPAQADGEPRNTLNWLLGQMDAIDRRVVQQAVTDAIAQGGHLHVRFVAHGLDGQACHLVLNGRMVADLPGTPPVLAGTLRDVSLQARAQSQLADTAATLQRMCNQARIGPWQADPAGGTLTMSAMALELFGLTADSPLPPWRDFCPTDVQTRERVQAARQRLLADGVGYDMVLPVNLPGGGRRWVHTVAAAHYTEGLMDRVDGAVQDVSEQVLAQQALRDTTRRFELATAHAGMGVYEIDIVAHHRTWSEGMYPLFGFEPAGGVPSSDEVDGRLVPEDRPLRRPDFERACADRHAHEWSSQFRVLRPDGSQVWLQSRCQIERDDSGRALRALGTTLDVTHAHTVARERQARAEAEARSQAKSAFLSRMSHELRTPLHAMIGYAQLVNTHPVALTDTAAPYGERIENAGWHLLALIDDVLELARIESDSLPIPLQAVALDDLAREAVSYVEHEAVKACLRLEVSLQPIMARANPTRVRQVLVNLLSNAIKYTLAGGSVHLSVRAQADLALVEVADTGLGMTQAQLAGLYEPFNRLGRECSGVEGTGIGLAISKGLVERMGGSLAVESRVDIGTTFTLRLPLATHQQQVALPIAADATDGPAAAPRMLEVLCIEDNEVNALLLCETLDRLRPGWPVRVAGTGVQATQMLREAPAGLVFLDLNLPDTHGLDWLKRARQAHLLEAAEVVLLTADAMPQTRAAAEAAGLRHFLFKPFRISDLERLLQALAAPGRGRA